MVLILESSWSQHVPLVFCEIIKMPLASESSTTGRKDIFIGKKLPDIIETLFWLWLLAGLALPAQSSCPGPRIGLWTLVVKYDICNNLGIFQGVKDTIKSNLAPDSHVPSQNSIYASRRTGWNKQDTVYSWL